MIVGGGGLHGRVAVVRLRAEGGIGFGLGQITAKREHIDNSALPA
jgi:hypothetical protein